LTLSQNPCARNYKKEILAGFLDRTIALTMVIGSHFGAFCDLVWSVLLHRRLPLSRNEAFPRQFGRFDERSRAWCSAILCERAVGKTSVA
jgi:hypothetical protein